jgi:hypothetical protein
MSLREPILNSTPILSLRPTQITLGMHEVHQKRNFWRQKTGQGLTKFLESHMVPTILRPHLKAKAIKADFKAALAQALALSKTPDADYLPGWCGPKGYAQAHPASAKGKKAKPK